MKLTRWISQPATPRRIAFSQAEQAITCLAILLESHRYMISASEIRGGRPLSQCQFEQMTALAKELGFTLIESTINDLSLERSNNLSKIVNLKDQGSVVLSIEGKNVWINNPFTGITNVTDSEKMRQLCQCKGLSLDLKKMPTNLKRNKPSLLWGLLLSDKSLYSVGAVIVFLSLIHGLIVLLDPIIKNIYFTNVVQMGIVDWARTLAILYFLVAVIGGALLLAGSALSLLLTNRLALKWSFNTYTALLRLPTSYLAMRSRGDLMNRVCASEQLGSFIGTDEIMLLGSLLNLCFLFVVLISTSVPLALMLLCIQILSLTFLIKTNGGWKTRSDHLQQQSALETGSFVSLIGNVRLLHQQKMTDNAFRVHQLVVNRRTRAQQEMSLYTIFVHFGSTSIDTLQSVVLLTMAALLIMDGQITLGEYVGFQAILASVIAPIKQIANFISKLQTLRATHERILDVIEESSLQEKHGIGDRLSADELLSIDVQVCSTEDSPLQSMQRIPIRSLSVSRGQQRTCLLVKNIDQQIYLESAIAGELLHPKSVQINMAHTDGRRELLIALSKPHLYPGTIKDNISLGFPGSERFPIKVWNELATLVGWSPERLARDVQELAEDELELKHLSILRALWRGASGLLLSDLKKQVDEVKRSDWIHLIQKLSALQISIIFVTSEQPRTDVAWSQITDVSALVEAMMAADQDWSKV